MKKIAALLIALALLAGCSGPTTSNADMARKNLDTAAEQFEVERRIVFINGITDNYLLEVVGRCSYEAEVYQVVIICKTGPGDADIWKHSMIRSDNVTAVIEQTTGADVDEFRHRVIFKPEALLPDIDIETRNESDSRAEEAEAETEE